MRDRRSSRAASAETDVGDRVPRTDAAATGGLSETGVPPYGHLLGELGLRDAAPLTGEFAMEMPVGPAVMNNRGGLQGGLMATLVDILAGRAALQGLPPGRSVATSDLSMHFLSAVTVGPARAEATVLRRGRNKIVLRIDVYDAGRDDVLAAVSTATFVVVDLRPGQDDLLPSCSDGSPAA
jgi:uncharacterized protein (TIGR00369 family)